MADKTGCEEGNEPMVLASLENLAVSSASIQDSPTAPSTSQLPSTSTKGTDPPIDKFEYISNFNFPYCDDTNKYEKVAKIGQGTFGEVFKAPHRESKKKFAAMKKVLMDNEKEGFPITALREIGILNLLKDENVVNFIEVARSKPTAATKYRSTFFLVFDFCEHDLSGLLSNIKVKFSLGEIKRVVQQLLNGLYYIHSNKIMHRDLKAANILITKRGILKLADFGLSRAIYSGKVEGKPAKYTNRVVTLWYRPPELLLGEKRYGTAIDMWGAGCIMAEMWTRSPILQGRNEQQQLSLIIQLCGSITPENWPGVERLPLYEKMVLPAAAARKVTEKMEPVTKDRHACDLLEKIFELDPRKRYIADIALNHDFFWSDPMPCDLGKMMSTHMQSMFEYFAPPRRSNQRQSQQGTSNQNRKQPDNYQNRVY